MKRKKIVFFIVMIVLAISMFSGNLDIINQLCEKAKETEKKLQNYVKIINSDIYTYDTKGKLLTHEKKHYEIVWDGEKWVEKGIIKDDKNQEKSFNPFNYKDISYFNYSIKDKGDEYIIVVTLKDKFKDIKAEIGTYIVSKKTGYFKEENTTLSKMPSQFIETFKIRTSYGEIEKGLIVPVNMKNIINSKVMFGVGRKVVIITRYSYKKRKYE